jgi:DNA primase
MVNYDKLVEKLNLEKVQDKGTWIRACCPLHNESHPSFGINTLSGTYNCFVCGGGTIDALVSKVLRIDGEAAKDWLISVCQIDAADFNDYLQKFFTKPKRHRERFLNEHLLWLYKTNSAYTFRSLLKRGFTYQMLEDAEAGFDRLQNRITFPVRNCRGRLVGILGRSCNDGGTGGIKDFQTRWKIYFDFGRGNFLYGSDRAISGKRLIITEGILDVIRARQFGEDANIVALMTSHPTQAQIELIRDLRPSSICLMLDNDYAGYFGENILINRLVREYPLFSPAWPKGVKDLGETSGDQYVEMQRTITNVIVRRFIGLQGGRPDTFAS